LPLSSCIYTAAEGSTDYRVSTSPLRSSHQEYVQKTAFIFEDKVRPKREHKLPRTEPLALKTLAMRGKTGENLENCEL
jgi:hypothetical protein